jgi:hypothetical protein
LYLQAAPQFLKVFMAKINDIEISDMAFNAMVRKMHNRIVGCQNLFEIQQSSVDKFLFEDYVDDIRERNKKLKMWDEQEKWEQIELKKKREKKRELDIIETAKAKQKELQYKYILKLRENSLRNELFYEKMNTTLNRYNKIIIRANLYSSRIGFGAGGLYKYDYDLSFFKENRTIGNEFVCPLDIKSTESFFGYSSALYDYNYKILKNNILDKMIKIAKDNSFTSIKDIRLVFTKPMDSVNVFVYLNHICLFEIDLPEF